MPPLQAGFVIVNRRVVFCGWVSFAVSVGRLVVSVGRVGGFLSFRRALFGASVAGRVAERFSVEWIFSEKGVFML